MRSLLVVLAAFILSTLGCAPVDNQKNPNENPEACSEFRFLELEALKTLQFEYPVEVSNVGFCICPVVSISLTDANGDTEHFTLMGDLFKGISSATLHYSPIGREMFAQNDDALVDASLTLMGAWIARYFTADEIALFATTQGPRGCKENEPEMMARFVLNLADHQRYSRITEAIASMDGCVLETASSVPPESQRIQVVNLAEARKHPQPRPAGMLLQ